ncbi:hypothetical protein PGTUg99_017792 [Puccinia graminis f. sp. tritici]|uniref:Uncharacterized protein n=1 Tax=Puccinia graminis f. sp. tritici TaxID=56615 RepID=A0A5B0NKG8_PUCGR|nr:hypothetical protein PGTUg99_017792 [Puccinia graminis f. sp. tritici]
MGACNKVSTRNGPEPQQEWHSCTAGHDAWLDAKLDKVRHQYIGHRCFKYHLVSRRSER